MTERVLSLEGVHNFRDYGGYAVTGGGRLKRGLLWRSGQHVGASDADLAAIASLELADVFDLRSAHERTVHPCRRPAGFAARVFFPAEPPPRAARTEPAAPHEAAAQRIDRNDPVAARERLHANYHKIAMRPELIGAVRTMIEALAQGRGASLVNCMAGKDRTGIAVAIVHLACGVHRDDIIADYVLTNTTGDVEARIAAGAASIRATGGDMSDAVLRVLMGVEPEYLETTLDRIAAEFGSTDAYLRDKMGVDDDLRERLRDALVDA